jgi:hypothetical protein
MNLSTEFYQSLDSNDKEEFLRVFRNFKYLCKNFKFENILLKAEEWEKIIVSNSNLLDLKINFEDISKLLISMGECLMRSGSKSTKNFLSNNLKNQQSNSSSSNPNDEPLIQPGSVQSNFGSSPNMSKRFLPGSKSNLMFNQVTINKHDEDLIYQELKPIKFDGLFRKDMTSEEINEIIKKIEQDVIIDSQPTAKIGGVGRNLKGSSINASNVVTDNAYPFKQDCFKISCNIF